MAEASHRLIEFAPAKVNLALHIVGRRLDGYHFLDSLVAFADVGDELTFSRRSRSAGIELTVSGPFASRIDPGPSNKVWQTWQALADRSPSTPSGIAITLVKNLPVASGLGGGTADAAATLRGLMRLWDLSLPNDAVVEIAAALGADVPVSILSAAQHMSGVGEKLTPLVGWRPLPAVLVNPGVACPTAEMFEAVGLPRDKPAFAGLPPGVMAADVAWLRRCRNDLQETAIARSPVIAEVLAMLERCPGIEVARMSGSGATCFGVFSARQSARHAAAWIAGDRPAWWVRETTLR
jgi:4-diphosphocytidyl-2-C-methyl-D-erythritol kinase